MTNFRDTDSAAAFVETASSRETSTEIMTAIAFFARNEVEAVALWDGDGIGVVANLSDIWENATNNGARDDTQLLWGGRTLASIMADNA